MSKINLLPWREELRKALNKVFFFELGKNVVFTILIVLMFDQYFSHRIDVNNVDIAYINGESQKMMPKVSEIQALQKRKLEILSHITAIQNLQEDRFSIVKLIDTIPRVLPDHVYLTGISRHLESSKTKGPNAAPNVGQNNVVSGGQIAIGNKKQNVIQKNQAKPVETKSKYLIKISAISITNSSIATFLKNLENVSWLSDVQLLEVSENKNGIGLGFTVQCTQSVGKKGI